jgi:deazaflavin-dependent oxidoreductase (nitroreductase family)
MSDWNANIIEEFRTSDGNVGGMFEGFPLVLLTNTGAKSGLARIAPLASRDEDDRRFVFASKAGADSHPDWYYNIVANPSVTVEAPGETYQAMAKVVEEPERTEIYTRQGQQYPNFAGYQEKTERTIPVIELVRT